MPAFENPDVKDPSLFGVVFCALLVALLGALFGFDLLASIPSQPFESIADYESALEENVEPKFLNPHYFKGATSAPSNEWAQKRETFLNENSTTLDVNDADINAWVASQCTQVQVSSSEGEGPKQFAVLYPPNFFIDATKGIHFNIPVEISIPGKTVDCVLIGEGRFSSGNSPDFRLSKLSLNAASIPFPDKLCGRLLEPVFESFYGSDEFAALKDAWKKVDSVELIERGIRLNLN